MPKQHYVVQFTVNLHDGASYGQKSFINLSVTENLPPNVDALKYLRHRIGEELERNFKQLRMPIENYDEGKEPVSKESIALPSGDDLPF